ncbi:hypothetical protein [Paenibacillus sp. WLX2291]|uniref:hypothetical protein n=1 Tax=Paenibacillus sp. WLX2291 TaxID=3296934 RepID=UPI00398459B1
MSRRTLGGVFCFIAAFLYSTYFICASILGAGTLLPIYDTSLTPLTVGAWIFLIAGIVFIILAEMSNDKRKS